MSNHSPILLRGQKPPRRPHPLAVLLPFAALMIALAFVLGMRDGVPEIRAAASVAPIATAPSELSPEQAAAPGQPAANAIQIEEMPAMQPGGRFVSPFARQTGGPRQPDAAIDIQSNMQWPQFSRRVARVSSPAPSRAMAQAVQTLPANPGSPDPGATSPYRTPAPAPHIETQTAAPTVQQNPAPPTPAVPLVAAASVAPSGQTARPMMVTRDRARTPETRNTRAAASHRRDDREIDPNEVRRQNRSFFDENDFGDERGNW